MRRPARTRAAKRAFALSVLVSLAALAACGGGSPTQPAAAPGNVVRFDDPRGRLGGQQAAIQELLAGPLERASGALSLDGVTITVSSDASQAIDGYGVGGFTPDGRTVRLYVDTSFPDIARLLPERLPPVLVHELHHARRWRGPGYGRTLLEAMITEGLADHFAVELLGAPVPPWSDALPEQDTARFVELARPEFDSASYSHSNWFYGTSAALPRWTGYTLGYRLVAAYQADHAGASAAQLVDTPASAFRPD